MSIISNVQKPTNDQIKSFVTQNAGNPGAIQSAMRQYGVNFDDVKAAGNWSDDQVSEYVANSGNKDLQNSLLDYRSGQAQARSAIPTDLIASLTKAGATTQPQTVSYTPATYNGERVNRNETMEGIISRLVGNTDTPWMQRAQAIAREEVNNRGLLSSSIAANAGSQAAIDAAGDIAKTDANIYAGQRQANTSARAAIAQSNANNQLTADRFNADSANTLARDQMGFAFDVAKGFIQRDTDIELARVRAGLQFDAQKQLDAYADTLRNSATGKDTLTRMTQRYVDQVNAIRYDPDLDENTKSQVIANTQSDWREEATRVALIYNVQLPPEYLPRP